MTVEALNLSATNRQTGNIFAGIPATLPGELFETLLQNPTIRIERIVSKGHITPDDTWYDQDCGEWVLLVQGKAALLFEDSAEPVELRGGDYLFIPAHRKHRVTWTDPRQESIWLAIHLSLGEECRK
jgi:cupin 2 domain-containing protein